MRSVVTKCLKNGSTMTARRHGIECSLLLGLNHGAKFQIIDQQVKILMYVAYSYYRLMFVKCIDSVPSLSSMGTGKTNANHHMSSRMGEVWVGLWMPTP